MRSLLNKRAHRRRSIGIAANDGAVIPLYTQADAEQVVQQFKPVTMHTPQLLAGSTADAGFTSTTFDAGHMLGSTCVLIEAREKGQTTRLLFSGDVGRKGLPIIKDPETAPAAEYLIMESTYGNRLHQPIGPVKKKLATSGEPYGAAWRPYRYAGLCRGADPAGGAAAA